MTHPHRPPHPALTRSIGPIQVCLNRLQMTYAKLEEAFNLERSEWVQQFVQKLFSGQVVNASENRAAGHWTLRAEFYGQSNSKKIKYIDGITPALTHQDRNELTLAKTINQKLREFTEAVHEGRILNPQGETYQSILHLGIGGSDLGPRLLHDVFRRCVPPIPGNPIENLHFAANVDYHDLQLALHGLNPARTLVVIASKSFSTRETLHNADHILKWLDSAGPNVRHAALVAVTCKPEKAQSFGIAPERIFEFSETVGGRYSLWGPVSLALRLKYGNHAVDDLLKGAASVDEHMLSFKGLDALPTLLATADLLHVDNGIHAHMLSSYDARLGLLVPYLQQLWMESLGKGVDNIGRVLWRPACPLLWGDVGTNSQHAFFQMLHQGVNPCSIEIVLTVNPTHTELASHQVLLSHALAQAQAFYNGKLNSPQEHDDPKINTKTCPGNRPVIVTCIDELTPNTLGTLLALWEHRTAMLAALQNINPFDQWGVELGKVIAEDIEPHVQHPLSPPEHAKAMDDMTNHVLKNLIAPRLRG